MCSIIGPRQGCCSTTHGCGVPEGSQVGNPHAIRRISPHRFCPELPILGTRIISPPSALCQARSPAHRRHSVLPTLGTLQALLSAPITLPRSPVSTVLPATLPAVSTNRLYAFDRCILQNLRRGALSPAGDA